MVRETNKIKYSEFDIIQIDKQKIWHPFSNIKIDNNNICIVKAKGIYLTDINGKNYIDAVSSWWVTIHGHCHPYITEAISKQIKTLDHVIFAGYTHPVATKLADYLLKKLPYQDKIFFSDDGSTAVEVAIKMALQYWYNKSSSASKIRKKILSFKNAYHGDTFGAMSVSARSAFTKAFSPFLFDVIFIPLPLKGYEKQSKDSLQKILKENKNDIAAFIFEPIIQGAGGMNIYSHEILDELIFECKKNDILIIADEVLTGFGHTGKLFANDYLTNKADIIALSKGLTGGTMALGITTCNNKIFDAFVTDNKFKSFFHGHSFTANPIACSAALASCELFDIENTLDKVKKIEIKYKTFANKLKNFTNIENIRFKGNILAFDIKTKEGKSYFNNIKTKTINYFLKNNIIVRPLGNVFYLMPPYCINDDELDYIFEIIIKYLMHIKNC